MKQSQTDIEARHVVAKEGGWEREGLGAEA